MKGINIVLFTVLCGAIAVAQPSNLPSSTFRSNGTFGNANGTTPDGLTQFMLTVTRGTGNNSPQPGTFVNYFVSSQNADSNGFTTKDVENDEANVGRQGGTQGVRVDREQLRKLFRWASDLEFRKNRDK